MPSSSPLCGSSGLLWGRAPGDAGRHRGNFRAGLSGWIGAHSSCCWARASLRVSAQLPANACIIHSLSSGTCLLADTNNINLAYSAYLQTQVYMQVLSHTDTYVCLHIDAYACSHTYTCMLTYMHMHALSHTNIHAHTHAHTHQYACSHIHNKHACSHIHNKHECSHTHTCICMLSHTHTPLKRD